MKLIILFLSLTLSTTINDKNVSITADVDKSKYCSAIIEPNIEHMELLDSSETSSMGMHTIYIGNWFVLCYRSCVGGSCCEIYIE